MKEIIDKLYNLNANISLHYIGMGKKPTKETMITINKILGNVIKELRNIEDGKKRP